MAYAEVITRIAINLTSAVLIILLGFIIGRFLSKITYKILHDLQINLILENRNLKLKFEETASFVLEYFIYISFFIIAVRQLGLTSMVFNTIILLTLFLILVFIFISLKDFFPNFISGLFIKKYKPNQKIKINNIEGKVIEINLTGIVIKRNEDIIIIPYSYLRAIQR